MAGTQPVPAPGKADSAARFGLLASAVAGRTVPVAEIHAERAWSDGSVIYLPDAPEAASDAARSVVAQAALISAGTLGAKTARAAIRRRSGAANRYLTLEVSRATRALADVLPRAILDQVSAACREPVSTSAEESARRAADTDEPIAAPPAWFGRVKPSAMAADGMVFGGASPRSGDENPAAERDDLRELDEDDDGAGERSRILELLSAPAMRNPLAAAFMRMLGMGRAASSGAGGDELPVGGHRIAAVSSAATPTPLPRFLRAVLGPQPAVGTRYPEWDCHRHRYREQWCSVVELDPAPRDAVLEPPSTNRALRRELIRLGLRRERHRRQPDGEDVDLDAAISFVVDRRAGAAQDDPRVYETRSRTGRDLGVVILLDSTGSSAEQTAAGAGFDEHRAAAEQLTQTLDEIGDRVATYGFYSRGRGSVRLLRSKAFDDPFDHAARVRLANLTPTGFTRLGAAIRHCSAILDTRSGTSNRLVILIGDGFAYDDGYEDSYARQDTRRALAEARALGIGTLGLRVGTSSADDAFGEVWAGGQSLELRDLNALAREIRPAMTEALTQARTARRDFQ